MKILNKTHMMELCRRHPKGGVAFCEYIPECYQSELMVTEGAEMFATCMLPDLDDGKTHTWDWSLDADYEDGDLFVVFNEDEIREMVRVLESALTRMEEEPDAEVL